MVALNDFTISWQADSYYIIWNKIDDPTRIPFTEVSLKRGESTVLSISYKTNLLKRIFALRMRYFYDNLDRWIFGRE